MRPPTPQTCHCRACDAVCQAAVVPGSPDTLPAAVETSTVPAAGWDAEHKRPGGRTLARWGRSCPFRAVCSGAYASRWGMVAPAPRQRRELGVLDLARRP